MQLKEKAAYILGTIIVIYGAFAGKDLTNMPEIFEGVVFLMFFLSIFIVFYYINARGKGDWRPEPAHGA
ncbi:hypothetical protein DRO31_08515 [Candidatus Bathyarchaeota archaeon]|nr:MAG: hypothetical protein DRO31_08515 [Candidatus Bathyarchaeota archaeon]